MTRASTVLVVAVVIFGTVVTGVATLPAAAQGDGREFATVELGAIDGATVCVQQLTSDTNQLVVQDTSYEDITIYFDEERRLALEQTQPDATLVLHTDRQDEGLNQLADLGECVVSDQTNAVVDAEAITTYGLSGEGYLVEAGPSTEVPGTDGFDFDEGNETNDGSEDGIDGDLTGPVDDLDNETEQNASEPVSQTTDTVTDTVDSTTDTVNDTVNHTANAVNDTVDHTEHTVDETTTHLENTTANVTETVTETPTETDEQLAETTDETVSHTEETVDETGNHTETVAGTADRLGNTTDEVTGSPFP